MTGLESRFVGLVQRLTNTNKHEIVAEGWFRILMAMYSQEHRKYHNLTHVNDLLIRLSKLTPYAKPGLDRLLETEVAIWFHDAVYNVPSKTNEEESALLARAFLFSINCTDTIGEISGRPGSALENVQEAIMATKHDNRELKGNAARVMVDLDLAGFADPWETFDANNKKIREEYSMFNDEQYRWGRVHFLSGMLGTTIYHTVDLDYGLARQNIIRHMGELMLGPRPNA